MKKSHVKSASRISEDRIKKSTKAVNLRMTSSILNQFARSSDRKQKSQFSKSSPNTAQEETGSSNVFKQPVNANVPKNIAAHFGNFYGLQGSTAGNVGADKTNRYTSNETSQFGSTPRSEFTRQMVHKLELTSGTEEYARQVSALLEETVEPPHFKLNPLPAEDSIPDGKQNPSGYPLWYKEPYKMPRTSDEIYKILKGKHMDENFYNAKEVFEEETSDEDIEDTYEELSGDGENKEGEDPIINLYEDLPTKMKESPVATFSSRSTSGTETKDTDSGESNDNLTDNDEKYKSCNTLNIQL